MPKLKESNRKKVVCNFVKYWVLLKNPYLLTAASGYSLFLYAYFPSLFLAHFLKFIQKKGFWSFFLTLTLITTLV